MSFDHLDRGTLARLLPELLLCGHLIDRAGMPHVIGALGREGMGEVAIQEWMAASPVYTRRTREALGITGDGVPEIFRSLQHDIGAPPQFLDFRYTIRDASYGEFRLAYCGALMDVEPMGDDYVTTMCHDIEDPTFDATAAAINPRARMRPIHRPPRKPADRHPHCAWTVTIDEARDPLPMPEAAAELAETGAARFPLATVPNGSVGGPAHDGGLTDYTGDFQPDVDWGRYARALQVRLADEFSLQWHLLALGCERAVRRQRDAGLARAVLTHQLVGIAGLASGRFRDALALPAEPESVAPVLDVHPVLNPAGYTGVRVTGSRIDVDRAAPGGADPGWVRLLHEGETAALDALVHGVCPRLRVEPEGDGYRVVDTGAPIPEPGDVALTRLSHGADFRFEDRARLLPIEPSETVRAAAYPRPSRIVDLPGDWGPA